VNAAQRRGAMSVAQPIAAGNPLLKDNSAVVVGRKYKIKTIEIRLRRIRDKGTA
jgi:hypothetical protein